VHALLSADLSLFPGEIHALLGENGAGKTTLVSIAAGRLAADAGEILRAGRPVRFARARDAREAGLALVPQHDLLVGAASVADNLALLDARAPFFETRRDRRTRVARLASTFGLELGDADARVEALPVGTRQRIEIAGALAGAPEVLVLDEPTAVLSPDETAALFAALRRHADAGAAVVVITHRLAEVFAGADRLTLLARGRTVKSCRISETSAEEIGALLLAGAEQAGNSLPSQHAARSAADSPSNAVPNLALTRFTPRPSQGQPFDVSLLPGELVLLLAIDGNGADSIASAIAGLAPFSGSVRVAGAELPRRGDPLAFRAAGGAFVPADRREEGLVLDLTLEENLALPRPPGALLLDRRAMRARARARLADFAVRAPSPLAPARVLSGGNQQKLVLARELADAPRLVVAVHPTRGLDLAASAAVRARLAAACAAGASAVVVTADADEAFLFGGSVRVVYRGSVGPPAPEGTPVAVLGRKMAGLAA
jgi:simple sugar transport system ATP-binding protein